MATLMSVLMSSAGHLAAARASMRRTAAQPATTVRSGQAQVPGTAHAAAAAEEELQRTLCASAASDVPRRARARMTAAAGRARPPRPRARDGPRRRAQFMLVWYMALVHVGGFWALQWAVPRAAGPAFRRLPAPERVILIHHAMYCSVFALQVGPLTWRLGGARGRGRARPPLPVRAAQRARKALQQQRPPQLCTCALELDAPACPARGSAGEERRGSDCARLRRTQACWVKSLSRLAGAA